MCFGTIGGMKVLAVKSIEVFGNLWTVRYTRLTKRGSNQDAHFLFNTPEGLCPKNGWRLKTESFAPKVNGNNQEVVGQFGVTDPCMKS